MRKSRERLLGARENIGHLKRRIAKKERRQFLEGAPKRVWKVHSFVLGWVCTVLFPCMLASYDVHTEESVGSSVLN